MRSEPVYVFTNLLAWHMLKLEVSLMEYVIGVEEARRSLGEMVARVSRGRETIVIARRAREKAVLMGYEEYQRLQGLAAQAASNKVAQALARIRDAVREAGVSPSAVEEAIREVRSR